MQHINILSLICLSASVIFSGCGGDEEDPVSPTPVTPNPVTPVKVEPINFGSATFGSVADIDGNSYKTVAIGTKTWMAENLRTTKFKNGDAITKLAAGTQWTSASGPGFFAYGNDDLIAVYGRLYNGHAMKDARGVCPAGWHVPTADEWEAAGAALGGMAVAGNKMKEQSTAHWVIPNSSDNQSGFTGLPGGSMYRGQLTDMGTDGYWWSKAEGVFYYLTNNETNLRTKDTAVVTEGLGIRCVKD